MIPREETIAHLAYKDHAVCVSYACVIQRLYRILGLFGRAVFHYAAFRREGEREKSRFPVIPTNQPKPMKVYKE